MTGAEAVSDARDGCARKGGAGSAAKARGHLMASIQEDDELEQESEAERTPLLRMPPGAAEDAAAQETPARLEEDGTLEEQRVLEELAQNAVSLTEGLTVHRLQWLHFWTSRICLCVSLCVLLMCLRLCVCCCA